MNIQRTIGNDIVDLHLDQCKDKSKDLRFLNRVFAEKEIKQIQESKNPDRILWSFWAAKETAYKVAKKLDPNTVFSHNKFEVDYESKAVRFGELIIPVDWVQNKDYIHCLGYHADYGFGFDSIETKVLKISDLFFDGCDEALFSKEEKLSIKSKESFCARFLAKDMLQRQGYIDIEIIRRKTGMSYGPPMVFQSKKQIEDIDVSLSHHGEWVAVAIVKG
ncbi:4'-phosphopantetheinyl transferase superfamily protein [bacterium]|nr:4'-phosphopantetheinyl transferase superfamily protein [bacterium]MBU1919006.1 4'-phosphopantetheinyl transferase superfamily protein [bacterium]